VRTFRSADEILDAVGETLGTSPWLSVDQKRIDGFADVTDDHQWLHVDPERAAAGPFGTTIAHGYLTLSLLPAMVTQNYGFEGARMNVNYGLNRVRYTSPVPVDSSIRTTSVLTDAVRTDDGAVQVTFRHTVERDGSERPVCVADALSRIYF
jgi:acyl dehydratase